MLEEFVYLGKNNTIELSLAVDGKVIDHTTITRCQIICGETTLDSSVSSALFDLTKTDRLILKFGASSLTPKRYDCSLIIFNASNPLGLGWGKLIITVS